jgi:hypothetical protein
MHSNAVVAIDTLPVLNRGATLWQRSDALSSAYYDVEAPVGHNANGVRMWHLHGYCAAQTGKENGRATTVVAEDRLCKVFDMTWVKAQALRQLANGAPGPIAPVP